ncbi:MAG: sodium:proton antiporter [Bacteroidia bacterium]|nr:MAG: sodium:proton antiporter [Bacteroidia bacterium]
MVSHEIPAWLLVPFGIMLGGIAIFPLVVPEWWEKNRSKLIVALTLGIPTALILISQGYWHELMHQMVFDYVPFIVLLGGLFTVTGGIHLEGDIQATPLVNTGFLGLGAVLASIMGTTGAAMLLIRPLLSTNMERKHKVHTVLFFIAIVANTGGLLTPLGDPPLFLLYLRGAPFTWFMHLAPEWLFINVALLAIYFVVDTLAHRREDVASLQLDILNQQPLKITGLLNFLWLAGVILSVAFINEQYFPFMAGDANPLKFIREAAIMLMIILSLSTTKKETREANRFTWHPMVEVAYLFIGIFITMTPALLYLKAHAANLGLASSLHFYFATGFLSGFLDNAPTALAFHAVAEGLPQSATTYVANIPEHLLSAISVGAVFFGSMTYIGNGPNFMIKAIAVENGIKMPNFIAYIYRFSLLVLLPLYILVGFLFLS